VDVIVVRLNFHSDNFISEEPREPVDPVKVCFLQFSISINFFPVAERTWKKERASKKEARRYSFTKAQTKT
jgi:hypothetical protein